MIITEQKRETEISGATKSFAFGIRQEDMSHVLDVLRNKMYSDKVLAVIRESSTNAFDAHVEADKTDVPIQVTLPSTYSPEFRVRDFGNALSENEIQEVFVNYGCSLRRNSNNVCGGYGFGSKSSFCYTDSFSIISHNKGKRCVYVAVIDAETQVGKVNKFSEEDTTETGLEIIVPVRNEDIDEFISKASAFFNYWKVKPSFDGIEESEMGFDSAPPKIFGNNWKLTGGTSVAFMGCVAYPISAVSLGFPIDSDECDIIGSGIFMEFPIGALSVSSSRESLEYSKETIQAIKSVVSEILASVNDILCKALDCCNNHYEAALEYKRMFEPSSPLCYLRRFAKRVSYKGQVLEYVFAVPCEIEHISRNRRGGLRRRGNWGHVEAIENAAIIINDIISGQSNTKRRLSAYFDSSPTISQAYLLSSKDGFAALFALKEFENYKFTKLSELVPEPLPPRAKSAINKKGYLFSDRSFYNRMSSSWTGISDIDLSVGGVYVGVKNYRFSWMGVYHKPSKLREIVSIVRPVSVYGFSKSVIAKIKKNSNWISLEDSMKKHIEDNKVKAEELEAIRINAASISLSSFSIKRLRNLLPYIPLNSKIKSLCKKIGIEPSVSDIDFLQNYRTSLDLLGLSMAVPTNDLDIQDEFDALTKSYPLIKYCFASCWRDEDNANMADYINKCEEKAEKT